MNHHPSSTLWRLSWLSLACLVCLTGCPGPIEKPPPPPPPPTPVTGAALYASYCSLCHGEKGEGYKADGANALNNQHFLQVATDEFLTHAILKGRPGTSMSAWGQASGGPLSPEDTARLVAYIRTWQSEPSLDVHTQTITGQISRGALYYEFKCQSCHGKTGEGGTHLSISNPEFLATASDGFLRHAIAKGRPNTPMPAFEKDLTPQNIDDIVALIRDWAKPPPTTPTDLPSKQLGNPLLHPDGKDPDFPLEGDFVSIEQLKAAYDAKAAMVILDARPPADYTTLHITGAVSVPFYAAKEYLDQLPKDRWIIAYCACPHAESGAAAKTLKANGYTKVKVFDEGFNEWKKREYPTTAGSKP